VKLNSVEETETQKILILMEFTSTFIPIRNRLLLMQSILQSIHYVFYYLQYYHGEQMVSRVMHENGNGVFAWLSSFFKQ